MTQEKNPSQSQTFNNSTFSNVQISQGTKVDQSQTIQKTEPQKPIKPEGVITFIKEMQSILQDLDLPETQKAKCSRHLQTVRDEVQEEQPNKEYAAMTLHKFTHILKDTGKATGAGIQFIDKIQPALTGLLPWLGEAKKLLVL